MNKRNLARIAIVAAMLAVMAFHAGIASAATTCTFTTVGTTMYLDADCTTDATILIPDGYTLDGNGYTITAVDPVGGHFLGAVVANGGTTAHVVNLTVIASGLADVCDGGADRLRGIMFEGASGSITNNTVDDINQGLSGCQEGNGIEVRNAPFDGTHPNTLMVTISGNTVTDYQKNGITANGDVMAIITDNTVAGLGPVGYIAQNGIQFGYGATGQARDNAVIGSWYTGAGWTASGVLVFEANNVKVQDNTVSGNQSGIVAESWCWLAPSATNNKITNNTVTGADWGITVDAIAWVYTSCDPSADNNKVVGNTVTATAGDIGIYVGTVNYASGFTPSANNNKVINNTISGYTTSIDTTTGTATKVHANSSSP